MHLGLTRGVQRRLVSFQYHNGLLYIQSTESPFLAGAIVSQVMCEHTPWNP